MLDDHVNQLRTDARHNYEQVVEAAIAALAENGIGATVTDIAARAGVGRATVYRSFPKREDLLAAVAAHKLEIFTVRVDEALARADAWEAFVDLLHEMAAAQVNDRVFAEVVEQLGDHPLLAPHLEAVSARMRRLLEQAKATGKMQPGLTYDQLSVLVAGTARVLADRGETDLAVWRANTDLIVRAARA